jgi:hypothetical protein
MLQSAACSHLDKEWANLVFSLETITLFSYCRMVLVIMLNSIGYMDLKDMSQPIAVSNVSQVWTQHCMLLYQPADDSML